MLKLFNRIALWLAIVVDVSFQQEITILRTVDSSAKEYPWSSRDKFNINGAKCAESLNQHDSPCLQYGSFTHGQSCFCKCPYVAPTLIYEGSSSSCTSDGNIRNSKGCGFLFDHESADAGLVYMNETHDEFVTVLIQNDQCSVSDSSSEYLDCGNNWKPLEHSRRAIMLQLESIENGFEKYKLKIDWSVASTALSGFIIKLGLTCQPLMGNSCILFKIPGKVDCPVNVSVPLTTPSPTRVIKPTVLQPLSSFTSSIAAKPFSSLSSLSSSISSTEPPTKQNKPANKRRSDDSSTLRMMVILIPVAVAVVLLTVSIIAFCILLRRRRSREKSARDVNENSEGAQGFKNRSLKEVQGTKLWLGIDQEITDRYSQANPAYESSPRMEHYSQVNKNTPEFTNITMFPTSKSPAENGKNMTKKIPKVSSNINNTKVMGASTEILWHPNQDERLPLHGRNMDSLSDYYSYDDDDEWSDTQGYVCLEVSQDSRRYITRDPYSTSGDENTYEALSAPSQKSIVENKRHVNENTGEVPSIEMTELQHQTNKYQVTAPDSENRGVEDVYTKTDRNNSQANDSTLKKDEAGDLYEADYNDIGGNIYDTAEGLEGQPIEKPEGNRLSQDFSRLSVLSSVFDTSEEKHVYDICDDEGDYDAPEDIIIA